MIKLWVILSSFTKAQISREVQAIKNVTAEEYVNNTGVGVTADEIAVEEGRISADTDIAVVYTETPKVINAAQKLRQFGETLAVRLNDVIPRECRYGGRVSVYNKGSVKNFDKYFSEERAAQNTRDNSESADDTQQSEYEKMSLEYTSEKPRFTFEQLVLTDDVKQNIMESIAVLRHRDKLFNEWGLKAIMNPSVLLNLYGDSGTGKTMAAEAITNYLGKNIIRATYADIESKYHGEGPKKLKALFAAAEREDAVLFIDEADSMLSARLSNVTQGSEQAINSMRSQLLISLENFNSIVIFATNLIENYDKAFLTRLICIEMKRPDKEGRKRIWHNHLYPVGDHETRLNIPLSADIDLDALAEYDFCGRDIRNAVKRACISAVLDESDVVTQKHLVYACDKIKNELDELKKASKVKWGKVREITGEEKVKVAEKLTAYAEKKLDEKNEA